MAWNATKLLKLVLANWWNCLAKKATSRSLLVSVTHLFDLSVAFNANLPSILELARCFFHYLTTAKLQCNSCLSWAGC